MASPQKRRENRRKIAPGFPIEPRQLTLPEIREYYAGDKIQCLLCGRNFKKLGPHLQRIHEAEVDQYQQRYGLPVHRGLSSESFHTAMSKQVVGRIESYSEKRKEKMQKDLKEARTHIDYKSVKKNMSKKFAVSIAMENRKKTKKYIEWKDEDYYKILEQLKLGKTYREVVHKSPFGTYPKASSVLSFRKKNPEFEAALQAIVASMPYEYQARNKMGISQQFEEDVKRLRERGIPYKDIAKQLGVAAMTIHRHMQGQSS